MFPYKKALTTALGSSNLAIGTEGMEPCGKVNGECSAGLKVAGKPGRGRAGDNIVIEEGEPRGPSSKKPKGDVLEDANMDDPMQEATLVTGESETTLKDVQKESASKEVSGSSTEGSSAMRGKIAVTEVGRRTVSYRDKLLEVNGEGGGDESDDED